MHHRDPGLAGAALDDERVSVSVIADLVHVHPSVLRLVHRLLGDRMVLVSDAAAWAGAARAPGWRGLTADGSPGRPLSSTGRSGTSSRRAA